MSFLIIKFIIVQSNPLKKKGDLPVFLIKHRQVASYFDLNNYFFTKVFSIFLTIRSVFFTEKYILSIFLITK